MLVRMLDAAGAHKFAHLGAKTRRRWRVASSFIGNTISSFIHVHARMNKALSIRSYHQCLLPLWFVRCLRGPWRCAQADLVGEFFVIDDPIFKFWKTVYCCMSVPKFLNRSALARGANCCNLKWEMRNLLQRCHRCANNLHSHVVIIMKIDWIYELWMKIKVDALSGNPSGHFAEK